MLEVLHYETSNKNKVIGYVDIKMSINSLTMVIRKIAHVQSGDRKWFNLPSFKRSKSDGTFTYLKFWQFEAEAHNGQFLESLSDKVKEYCQKNDIKQIEALNFDVSIPSMDETLPF